MKLFVCIGSREIETEVGDSAVTLRDRTIIINEDGAQWLVVTDGDTRKLVAVRNEGDETAVYVDGIRFATEIERPIVRQAREILHVGGPGTGGSEFVVPAPMPGLVRHVMVAPGDLVVAGQVLLMLEAMKMENEIRSPRDGKVLSIDVAAGGAIEKGRPLVHLEAS